MRSKYKLARLPVALGCSGLGRGGVVVGLGVVVVVLVLFGYLAYAGWLTRDLSGVIGGGSGGTSSNGGTGGCNRSGFALVPNSLSDEPGDNITAHYRMFIDSKTGKCMVKYWYQVDYAKWVDVMDKSEWDKFVLAYLDNVSLSTLNGSWVSAGGSVLTGWWNSLREVKAGEIQGYIDGLWERLYTNYTYQHVFTTSIWNPPPKPRANQTVKIYSIHLWYGGRLDVLAYQNPGDPASVEIVMYGTVENWTKFTRAVALTTVFYGNPNRPSPNPMNIGTSIFEYNRATWYAWKIQLDHLYRHSHLSTSKINLKPEIHILLEEPMIYSDQSIGRYDFYTIEYIWWQVVGFPAFSLASNIMLPPHPTVQQEVEWAVRLTKDVVLSYVNHPGNDAKNIPLNYPSLIRRLKWGVCHDQSITTAEFASEALGMYSVYVSVDTTSIYGVEHAISYILIPSSVGSYGDIPSLHDVDRDGRNDTLYLIVDTAHLSNEQVVKLRDWETVIPPLSVPDLAILYDYTQTPFVVVKYYGDATGMLYYPDALPEVFTPPWWSWVKQTYPHKNYTVGSDVFKWVYLEESGEETTILPNNTRIRVDIMVTPCASPEDVYHDIMFGDDEIADDYGWGVHIPVSTLVKGYTIAIQKILPHPQDIALQPPTKPVNTTTTPPPLSKTVPALDQPGEYHVKINFNKATVIEYKPVNCSNS